MKAKLCDLREYRENFQRQGITYPVSVIESRKEGLLKYLPSINKNRSGWPWTEETNPLIYHDNIDWPKLTIVTPSYNQGNFLEETIRSVVLQNYPNLEYIIIDGGSTDNSSEIIEKYSSWISYWRCDKDEGQGQAINMGFSLASGEYYAWINSDDYYLKNVFKLIVSSFLKKKPSFIYGYAYHLNINESKLNLIKVPPLLDYFIKIPTLVQPSTFWNANIHQPIWEEMHCALDYELWLRLVKGQKRKRLKQPLSVAQAHHKAKTSDPEMKVKWAEDHSKMWSIEGHGPVPEWKRIVFLNRIRMKFYRLFNFM